MKKSIFLAFTFLVSSVAASHSWAAEEGATSVGLLGGLGAYNNSLGSNFTFGASAHHLLNPNFSVGLTVTDATLASVSGSVAGIAYSATATIMHLDADFLFHFSDLKGLWAGARVGLGSYSVTSTIAGVALPAVSTSSLEYGPAVGYDVMLGTSFSVGADLSYLMASYSGTSMSVLQALGAVKFHF